MIDAVEKITVYYDAEADNPIEDPAAIRDQAAAVADSADIEYQEIDKSALTDDERAEFYDETVGQVGENPYSVGRGVMTQTMFGSKRPAAIIRYEDDENELDVYPHRSDFGGDLPIGVLDLLADVTDPETEPRSDYHLIRPGADIQSVREDKKAQQERSPGPDSPSVVDRILAKLPI